MKTVGKQLQEARLARNWTPELAARETKIKVDRLRDLEADDYSHFTSPTYARGFVRTYARSLGLDEYKILRQLDNKLPEDDTANIVTDTGIAYLPETSLPPRVAHRNYAGLYIVLALGGVVSLIIAFVLLEAYRVGELRNFFTTSTAAGGPGSAVTNSAPAPSAENATDRALPVDSNTPPPIPETTAQNPAPSGDTGSVRALPVDPSLLTGNTNAAPNPDAPFKAVRALPVDPSELTNAAPQTPADPPPTTGAENEAKTPPRALPVDPRELAAGTTSAIGETAETPKPPPVSSSVSAARPPLPGAALSARQSNSGPLMLTSVPSVAPSTDTTPSATAGAPKPASTSDQRLVLTATQDSFVRVTAVGAPDSDKPLYAAVLHSGQSVGFDGPKFSVNVGIPAAVNIKLDGVNYGPHSEHEAPETFIIP